MPARANQTASGTASLSDILSAIQNVVKAVNAVAQNYLNVQGLTNAAALSAGTIVKASAGRVAQVSVTSAVSAGGIIYDSASLSNTSKPIYIIPNTVGIYTVNLPASYGIYVLPGLDMIVTVSYS
jgi:hypothetical protein